MHQHCGAARRPLGPLGSCYVSKVGAEARGGRRTRWCARWQALSPGRSLHALKRVAGALRCGQNWQQRRLIAGRQRCRLPSAGALSMATPRGTVKCGLLAANCPAALLSACTSAVDAGSATVAVSQSTGGHVMKLKKWSGHRALVHFEQADFGHRRHLQGSAACLGSMSRHIWRRMGAPPGGRPTSSAACWPPWPPLAGRGLPGAAQFPQLTSSHHYRSHPPSPPSLAFVSQTTMP